jgi:hypothetical protein
LLTLRKQLRSGSATVANLGVVLLKIIRLNSNSIASSLPVPSIFELRNKRLVYSVFHPTIHMIALPPVAGTGWSRGSGASISIKEATSYCKSCCLG